MAAEGGVTELFAELGRLDRDERDLSALRRKLHERIDGGFRNDVTLARERQVSDERRVLHRRIDALRAQLAALQHPV